MQAITAIYGVTLLDCHSDSDHNRTVVTFVGAPVSVEEASFQGIRKAAELIDLNKHTGSHPRIGATDVVPFVPIRDVIMADCVAMARRLGKRVGKELKIPVYLYEEAATRPNRQNLEEIRRGQYEGLKAEIKSNPERKPDYGPACVGPAGATVIGARHTLIAFNVYLDTDDVSIAKAIARNIRTSSGGLPCVKSLGMLVEGWAQVSMNLTNYRQTALAHVVETIRRDAARYGVSIHHSELVGLIPQEALMDAASWYLQLNDLKPGQILEQRLYQGASTSELSASASFLDVLATGTPAPGGGSAAAHAGAMGAALVAMVARLTIGKRNYQAVQEKMNEILKQAERLRAELTEAVQADSAAFEAVMAAFKLPKNTEKEESDRNTAIEEATKGAAQVPLKVSQNAVSVMALAERAVALGNLNAISDAASAAAMARASLTAAGYNIRVNIASLSDGAVGDSFLNQLLALEERATKIEEVIQKTLSERGKLSPA